MTPGYSRYISLVGTLAHRRCFQERRSFRPDFSWDGFAYVPRQICYDGSSRNGESGELAPRNSRGNHLTRIGVERLTSESANSTSNERY